MTAMQIHLAPAMPEFQHRNDKRWLGDQIGALKELGGVMLSRWKWKAAAGRGSVTSGRQLSNIEAQSRANVEVRQAVQRLRRYELNFAADDCELCDFAAAKARQCGRLMIERGGYSQAVKLVEGYGLSMPKVPNPKCDTAPERQLKRLRDERWWRRQVRRLCGQECEALLRELGEVRRFRGLYVSNFTFNRWWQQQRRNLMCLDGLEATNEEGDCFTLSELSDKGVSNPTIRRNELMVRLRGFAEWVEDRPDQQWRCAFVTMTCPSKFHGWHWKGGENSRFQKLTPAEGQAHLNLMWQRARSALKRQGIPVFGFRIAEPHHDGTPHWHMAIYMPRCRRKAVRAILQKYAFFVDGGEQGASASRFDFVHHDPRRGSVAGYLAKYISKNIDGYKVGDDDECPGADAADTALRVRAWASVWNIRQFQQIGGPPVTVWRELRRLASDQGASLPLDDDNQLLLDLVVSADTGDWSGYTAKMGGAVCRRDRRPAAILYKIRERLGRFGELVKAVKGVLVDLPRRIRWPVLTRIHEWEITFKVRSVGLELLRGPNGPPLDLCQ